MSVAEATCSWLTSNLLMREKNLDAAEDLGSLPSILCRDVLATLPGDARTERRPPSQSRNSQQVEVCITVGCLRQLLIGRMGPVEFPLQLSAPMNVPLPFLLCVFFWGGDGTPLSAAHCEHSNRYKSILMFLLIRKCMLGKRQVEFSGSFSLTNPVAVRMETARGRSRRQDSVSR